MSRAHPWMVPIWTATGAEHAGRLAVGGLLGTGDTTHFPNAGWSGGNGKSARGQEAPRVAPIDVPDEGRMDAVAEERSHLRREGRRNRWGYGEGHVLDLAYPRLA